ncbi:MAG: hypothetical protein H7X79_04100 [Sporomusaceae bacterium]|nr:hypothetical protein [Sporomusaceae bacterium]
MKIVKILVIAIASLLGCFVGYNIFIAVKHNHSTNMFDYEPYMWIFNDSVKNDIDTNRFVSSIKERDLLFQYLLYSGYRVGVWEFKDLNHVELEEISINNNVDLSKVNIIPREVINYKASPEINIELGFKFNHAIGLNIDNRSTIITPIETPKYKGFYGIVNKLSLSDGQGKHLIIFDYPDGPRPMVFLFYRTSKGFYIIYIDSINEPFDASIIHLLDLS